MKILYHMPYVDALNAGRTIYNGYKNAFIDLGHGFETLTAEDDFSRIMDQFTPDIFMTCLGRYYLRYTDLEAIKKHKFRGMKVWVNTPFWRSPIKRSRLNENPGLANDKKLTGLIADGNYGDFYYNSCEQDDPRMEDFTLKTGCPHISLPLAADKIVLDGRKQNWFLADIAYVGTYLPEKRSFFKKAIFPLAKQYRLSIYGQDWTTADRIRGILQKFGQYYHLSFLKNLRKPRLRLADEGHIYASATVSINVHEAYQKKFGGECNERTFKVPLCNGFQITDDVACIRKYFQEDKEIVIARDDDDYIEKLRYYLKNPQKRDAIIKAGKKRVLAEHTYHHRVETILRRSLSA
jgi:spore maturation protein CgeB